MKEFHITVPLTPGQVKDRLETAFPSANIGDPELVRTADRMFCHIKPKVTTRSVMFTNGDGIDPVFVDIYLKETGDGTQLLVSPMTSGYLLAAKLFALPALWIIAPVLAVNQEGWSILPKMLFACTLITLLLWGLARLSENQERGIVKRIRETFSAIEETTSDDNLSPTH